MATYESPNRMLNGRAVSRETVERLEHFADLFQKWAKAINLVAPSTKSQLWQRHIADSAQIHQLSPNPAVWVDLGSGGGFPGVITAILLAEQADGWVHLIESNNKKAAFLRTAILETGARATVHPIRIEMANIEISSCDRLSARAVAHLDTLLGHIQPWMIGTNTTAFLHKGRDYVAEVEIARRRWQFDMIKHASVIEDESVILEIRGLVPLNAGES